MPADPGPLGGFRTFAPTSLTPGIAELERRVAQLEENVSELLAGCRAMGERVSELTNRLAALERVTQADANGERG